MERFTNYVSQQLGWQSLGEYVNTNTRILMKCPKGHENEILPSNFLKGSRCKTCAGQDPKVIREKFLNLLKETNFKLNGTFNGTNNSVSLICPNNHEFSILATHFIKNKSCKFCNGKSPIVAEQKLIEKINNNNWKLLDNYVNALTPIRIICSNGHIRSMLPSNIKKGYNCKICLGIDYNSCRESLLNALELENWKIIEGDYIDANTKIKVECNNKHQILITPSGFKCGKRCIKCNGTCPIESEKEFRKIAKNEGWEILSSYIGIDNHVSLKCPNNHIRNITPNNFKSETRCLECKNSRGMVILQKILDELNLKYIFEFNLQDKYYPKVRFDIYIEEINTIIEWDGIQHFDYTDFFHRKLENFHERQHYDVEKTKICINNNIKLIRMDYTRFNNSYDENLKFIKDAINSESKIIVSNKKMYDFMLINL